MATWEDDVAGGWDADSPQGWAIVAAEDFASRFGGCRSRWAPVRSEVWRAGHGRGQAKSPGCDASMLVVAAFSARCVGEISSNKGGRKGCLQKEKKGKKRKQGRGRGREEEKGEISSRGRRESCSPFGERISLLAPHRSADVFSIVGWMRFDPPLFLQTPFEVRRADFPIILPQARRRLPCVVILAVLVLVELSRSLLSSLD